MPLKGNQFEVTQNGEE